jgi:beta-galactosidase GanA
LTRPRGYEPYLGGVQVQDVAIYVNTEAKYDPADSGKAVDDATLSSAMPHVDAALCVTKTLIENHIPFGIITRASLGQLARHKMIILPNMLALSRGEADALREYVRAGGKLYASRAASLMGNDGCRQVDLVLSDVLGVSYVGETRETFTYIAPTPEAEALFGDYTARWPLGLDQSQVMVKAHTGAQVLGTTVLPYTLPSDPCRYAAIHSNPPGIVTGYPALVVNRYGAGQAAYCTLALEGADMHRDVFANLVRQIAAPFSVQSNAPKAVEVTTFHQADKQRYIISLVNFQKELPNIPVSGIRVSVRLGTRTARQLLLLPDARPWPCETAEGYVEFTAPTLETLRMFALDYD